LAEPRFVSIAKIIKSRGNRGEVAAEPLTDFPERFKALRAKEVALQRENEPPLHLVLESYWFHRNRIILKFKGVDSIAEAATLRDYELKVPRDQAVALPNGFYYQFDLLGCTVIDPKGRKYGQVTEVLEVGSNYLLKVDSGKQEILVPFVEEMLVRIDIGAKELVFSLPDGLVDL
jgi:16S rRNA processing protein RimM